MCSTMLIHHLKKILIGLVAYGFISANAGSYDDFWAAIKRDDAQEVTDLLRRGFDANTPWRDDKTGQLLATSGLLLALGEPSPKVAKVLIDWPQTNVELRTPADESPLMMAAFKGQDDLVAALIARGADVNKPGWAPLHYAATRGQVAVMQRLLDENAYIDAESPNKTTPLMMAAFYGSAEAVKLLIDAGADTTLKNAAGMTALDFANKGNRTEAADLLKAAGKAKLPRGTW